MLSVASGNNTGDGSGRPWPATKIQQMYKTSGYDVMNSHWLLVLFACQQTLHTRVSLRLDPSFAQWTLAVLQWKRVFSPKSVIVKVKSKSQTKNVNYNYLDVEFLIHGGLIFVAEKSDLKICDVITL